MKSYYTTIKLILLPILCFCLNMGYSQTGNYCDDFSTYNFQPNGDNLGYTQGGSFEIIDVPYFDTSSTAGAWYFNQGDPGIYGVATGAQFSFNGSYQTITYEIYGFYGQFGLMGFSVNGSSPVAFNGSFPVSIGGVFVNLDTNATDFGNWENVYLSFTGNVNEIKIYAFESGIIEMCIDSVTEDGCDDFTTYNFQPNGDTLGYTQGGSYAIIDVPYFDTSSTAGLWYFNQGTPGMYGAVSGAQFSFNGNYQTITYEIYGNYNQFGLMGFSVNGSSPMAFNGSFPVSIGGVFVNLDTNATDFGNWENVYLSFTGNVNEIKIYAFESGIIEMCVDSVIEDACDHFNASNWQPADTLGYTQEGSYPIVNVPYFGTGTATTTGWSQGFFGMYGANCGAQFSFDGSNQSVTYEVYGQISQFNQMGFSVNGSSAIALNGTFPLIVNGITVNLDTSAIDFPNWENVYLSFTGNVNEIEIYFFESGIVQMCADSLIVINSISKFSDINSVLMYPNPATEKVTIENKSDMEQQNVILSLINMQGQTIVSERVNFSATHTLDVSDVSSGIYMLTLRNDKMFYQNRIVIQK